MAKKSKSKIRKISVESAQKSQALPFVPSETAKPDVIPSFRSQALDKLPENDLDTMLAEKIMFEERWNEFRGRWRHEYKKIKRSGADLVFDSTTGLTWQRSGSPRPLTYNDAKMYIGDLNRKHFGGYRDWRLPSLEEAMFLVEPRKIHTLYIGPVFDSTQQWIWTLDESYTGGPWVVTFHAGCCYVPIDRFYYVRAVHGKDWFQSSSLYNLEDELLFGHDAHLGVNF